MSNDKSVENLNITKLMIYTLAFLSISAILILFLILPKLQEFKLLKERMNTQLLRNAGIKAKLDALQADVGLLNAQNAFAFKQFNTLFTQESLRAFLKLYLPNFILTKETPAKEKYLLQEYRVDTTIKNPMQFLRLTAAINKNKNLLRITMPVKLELRNENALNLHFRIKVYSLIK